MGITMDDRQLKRFDARFDVGLLGDLLDGTGRLVDVSTGGCRLRSAESMKPSGHVHLFLRSPHAKVPVKVEVAVIRWAKGQECGLEFIRVHPEQQKRLGHLVSTLQMGADVEPTRPHINRAIPQKRLNSATIRRKQDPSRWQDLLDTLYDRWG